MPLNAVKAAFDSLKADFRDARFPVVAGRLAGESMVWGESLLDIFRRGGRSELEALDSLARFWVLRYRGMPVPADLTGAPAGVGFVLAFTAFPYLDVMMDVWELGELAEPAEADRLRVRCLFDGVDEGGIVTAERAGGGWRFDLMPLYRDKVRALDAFVASRFGGSFDSFVRHYVAEHDLDFDFDQAWRPLNGA
ncbi:MAG: hypothetical protein EPN20_04765 [Magnetospirillum sp.]|nr:MAG: hypothetical protein EPN20_04765 [Magnetospirillum sp.]